MGTYVGHDRALRIRMETRTEAMAEIERDAHIIARATRTLVARGATRQARTLDVLLNEWSEQLRVMRVWQDKDKAELESITESEARALDGNR